MLRELKSYLVIAAMCIIVTAAAEVTALAADIPSDWAKPEIEKAKELGLITDKTSYGYKDNITREEFAELAVNMYEKLTNAVTKPNENPFKDTDNNDVLKAYWLGILTGKEKDMFAPDSFIKRQEIAVMLVNTIRGYNPYIISGEKKEFTDSRQISQWAAVSVDVLTSNNIMFEVGQGRFEPLSNTTKEQAVALILRIYQNADNFFVDESGRSDLVFVPQLSHRIGYYTYDKIAISKPLVLKKDTTEVFESKRFTGHLRPDSVQIENSIYFIESVSKSLYRNVIGNEESTKIGNRQYAYIYSADNNFIYCREEIPSSNIIKIDLLTYEETVLSNTLETDTFTGLMRADYIKTDDSVYFIDTFSGSAYSSAGSGFLYRYILATDELIQIGNRRYSIIYSIGNNVIYCNEDRNVVEINLTTYEEKDLQYTNAFAVGDVTYYAEFTSINPEMPTIGKYTLYMINENEKTVILDNIESGFTSIGIIGVKDGWLYYTSPRDLNTIYDTYNRYYAPSGISKVNIETGEVVEVSAFGALSYPHGKYIFDDNWIYYINMDYGLIHLEKMSDGDDEFRLYRVGINGENHSKLADEDVAAYSIFIRGNCIYYSIIDSYNANNIYRMNKDGSRKEILFGGDGMSISKILDVDKDYMWFWANDITLPEDKNSEIYIYKMNVHTKELTLIHTITTNDAEELAEAE